MAQDFISNPQIQPVLAELETLRKKIVSKQTQGWLAVAIGVILLFVIIGYGAVIIGIILGAAAIIPGGIILYKISDEAALYKSRFKHEIIGAALSSINQNLTIAPNDGVEEGEFIFSQLFTQEPDRYHTEDLITGKIDKTSFYFAEVHAEYKTETHGKNGKQTHWHDILKGIVFTADFNKNFKGITVVRPKDFGASLGAWFSKNVYSFGNKNVVELENDGFNKNFVVYSTDQIEARYILTPALMERIIDLNSRSAYTISLSFIDSRAYIAFPLDQNYFEAPVFKSLLKPDILANDMAILGFMYDIVHELDLNTRIWTKQ